MVKSREGRNSLALPLPPAAITCASGRHLSVSELSGYHGSMSAFLRNTSPCSFPLLHAPGHGDRMWFEYGKFLRVTEEHHATVSCFVISTAPADTMFFTRRGFTENDLRT